jgi:hypothetical protein
MATIIVRRAQPFKRGNASIQVLLDGKAAGVILKDESLSLAASDGHHAIRAVMHGVKGRALDLRLSESDTIDLTVSGTSIPKPYWWETLLFLLVVLMPWRQSIGKYFWLMIAIDILVLTASILAIRSRMRRILNIVVAEEESTMKTSALPA